MMDSEKRDLTQEKTYLQFNEYKRMYLPIGARDYNRLAKILNISEQDCRRIDEEFIHKNREAAQKLAAGERQALDALRQSGRKAKVLFVGDSNTSNRESYCNILRELFAAWDGMALIDTAVSGHTTQDVLNIFYTGVLQHQPDLAFIMLGTNDLRRLNDFTSKNLTSPAEFELNLRCIVERLAVESCKMILITVPYIHNRDMARVLGEHNWLGVPEDVRKYNAVIRGIAADCRTSLADLHAELEAYDPREYLLPDGLHLNSRGHEILARICLEKLLELFA